MRAIVADALRGGALGFSTDRAGFVAGANGRPVPSMIAAQDEVEALMLVTAEVGCGIVHIAPGDNYEWLYDFQRTLGRHVNWSSILAYPEGSTTRAGHRRRSWRLTLGRSQGSRRLGTSDLSPDRQLVTLRDPAPFSTVPAFCGGARRGTRPTAGSTPPAPPAGPRGSGWCTTTGPTRARPSRARTSSVPTTCSTSGCRCPTCSARCCSAVQLEFGFATAVDGDLTKIVENLARHQADVHGRRAADLREGAGQGHPHRAGRTAG